MPRGNPQNLIPSTERSKEEALMNSRKGGINSGKTRRAYKTFREACAGVADFEAMVEALKNQALKGNIRAFEVFRDTFGEKPVDKVVIEKPYSETSTEVEKYAEKFKK